MISAASPQASRQSKRAAAHKRVRQWIRRHAPLAETILTLAFAASLGLYVNLLSSALDTKYNGRAPSVAHAVSTVGAWHLLLVVVITASIGQYRLGLYVRRYLTQIRERSDLISAVLEAACKSLIYPTMQRHIRAIVTLREPDSPLRTTRYSYNTRGDPEQAASYPLDFGVTGEAYTTKSVVAKELPPDHLDTYDPPVKSTVLPQICSILAAPILQRDSQGPPLGVLAFDSTDPLRRAHFDMPPARDLAQRWADVLTRILDNEEER